MAKGKRDEITIDDERHEVRIGTKEVFLSPKGYEILKALKLAEGKVISRENLFEKVWGDKEFDIDTRTVDQHISRLRRALGINPTPIITVPLYGYKFKA